jgi:hypothetical protein
MLAMFQCKKTFCRLTVSLHVDVERREASGTVTYDRRIVRLIDGKDVRFHEVDTPEKADAWLSRPMGERGSLVEHLEWQARAGLLQAA